jgi:peptide deformylase
VHEVSHSRGVWNGQGGVRPIRKLGDPVLRQPCSDITNFDESLQKLVDDMFASMYAVDGIGLAANQIGVSSRVFVFDCPDGFGDYHRGFMVNPTRTFIGNDEPDDSEGCLSIPGLYAEFPRSSHVEVEGFDLDGRPLHVVGLGYFARCLMHETQHLDGKLFIDILNGQARRTVMKAIRSMDLSE